RDRSFLSLPGCSEVLERRARKRQTVWNQAVRSRRARYVAPGNVLSAERLRLVARAKSNRGRTRILRRSDKTKLYRTRHFARNKRKRTARKACAVSNERERATATTTLRSLRERRAHRRSNQRDTFSELELGRRDGVCLDRAREDRRTSRYRNPRTKVSSYHRKETALQKIMNVPDDLLYTESHEWSKREGDNVRIGITDHAQSELTDVVYVELPKMDRQANAKEAIAVVESVKAASDIYAAVKGTVVKVNKADDLKQLKKSDGYKQQIG